MWDYASINYKVYVCILHASTADEVTELVATKMPLDSRLP
jgi:hypothetical protein